MKRLIAYFWPFESYRDAEHGSMMERAAALRYNRQLSSGLPVYINRWAVCAAVELMLLQMVPVLLAPLVAVLLTVSVCTLMHLVRVWLVFRRRL